MRREGSNINKAGPCSLLKRLIAVVTPLPLTGINKELVFDMVSLWGGAGRVLVHRVSVRWEQMLLIGKLSSSFMNVKIHISKEPRDSLTSLTKVPDIKN